jgi:hypothetical protein
VRRFIFFILAIGVGIAAGLGYGWGLHQREVNNAQPQTLRMDYKADYVLMISELYHAEGDVAQARSRLAFLGDQSPVEIVTTAIAHAEYYQYDPLDLQYLQELKTALETISP